MSKGKRLVEVLIWVPKIVPTTQRDIEQAIIDGHAHIETVTDIVAVTLEREDDGVQEARGDAGGSPRQDGDTPTSRDDRVRKTYGSPLD